MAEEREADPERELVRDSDPELPIEVAPDRDSGDLRIFGPFRMRLFLPREMVRSISPSVARHIIPAIARYFVPAVALTCILGGLGYGISLVVSALMK